MTDLTAAVLAAIAERRKVAEAELDARDGNAYYAGDYARGYETEFGPVAILTLLDGLEAVAQKHPRADYEYPSGNSYCDECSYLWPCDTAAIIARLLLTADQLAGYGIGEPVA